MSTGAWSDANAQALGCNSTLQAAFQSALQVPVNAGVGWTEIEYAAAWSCRRSDNSTIARQANKLWPTINSYGYYPSNGFALFAMSAFGVSALWHIYQLIRSRRWSYLAVLTGSAIEVTGWQFRWTGSLDVRDGYIGQLATLTVGPTFFAGGVYALFYAFANNQDRRYMPFLGPKAFSWSIFVLEFITILVQVGGGVIASGNGAPAVFKVGIKLMTIGTALQLGTSILFSVFFYFYYRRLRQDSESCYSLRTHAGQIFWGTVAMEAMFIIRGSYRTAELSEGLFGPIALNQLGLIMGDTIPMIFVTYLLNAVHPWRTVRPDETPTLGVYRQGFGQLDSGSAFELKRYESGA